MSEDRRFVDKIADVGLQPRAGVPGLDGGKGSLTRVVFRCPDVCIIPKLLDGDVGYQNIQGNSGKKFIQGCQFMNVTGGSVDLQDIVFKSNGEIPENGCTIWWWDNNLPGGDMGYVEAFFNYWWYDPEDESLADSEYCGEGPCWTNEDELPLLIKKTFAPGEGFYVKPDMPEPKLFFPNPFAKK